MPTPFDTPITTPQPTFGQNLLGALGVTWGKTQSNAAQDAAALEKDRIEKRNAAIWGPVYGVVANTLKTNPNWSADKVMLEVIKSPEFDQARNTPGFDIQNLSKNLQEVVMSAYPKPAEYHNIPDNSLTVAQPQQGAAPTDQPKVVGQNPGTQKTIDQWGEVTSEVNPQGQFNPQGLPMGGGVQPGAYSYPGPNNTVATEPQVNWMLNMDTASQQYPQSAIYLPMYKATAEKYNLPVDGLISQGAVESDYWADDVVQGKRTSPTGAVGVAQFMPNTVLALSKKWGLPAPFDPTDPAQAIDAQGRFMSELLHTYQGNYSDALRAYNRGEEKFNRWVAANRDPNAEPSETRNYVARITGEHPRVQIAKAPGLDLKRKIETIPIRPPTRYELNETLRDEPGLMFAGRGLPSLVTKLFGDAGRSIDPSLASDLQIANESAKNKLIQLRALLTGAVPPGDTRLAAQVNSFLEMYPEDGIISDPIGGIQKGIDIFDFFQARMWESADAMDRYSGLPTEERKRAAVEYRRAARIVNFLGGDRQKLVQTQKLFEENKNLLVPSLYRKGLDAVKGVFSGVAGEIDRAGREPAPNASPLAKPQVVAPPPSPTVQPIANPQMPTVSSPEEAAKLPSGTKFYLPDGRIGTAP